MEFEITFNDDNNFFVIKTSGDFDIYDFEKLAYQLLEDPNWEPGANCIFDYRMTDFTKVGLKAFVRSKTLHSINDQLIGDGKSALVMKDLSNLGLGRIYGGMTEPFVQTKFSVFSDYGKAQEWIME